MTFSRGIHNLKHRCAWRDVHMYIRRSPGAGSMSWGGECASRGHCARTHPCRCKYLCSIYISRRDSTLYSRYICIYLHLRFRGPISTLAGKCTELRRPGSLECEGRGRERPSAGCALSTQMKHYTQRSAVTDGERLGSIGITSCWQL